jgi:hypothetical protein
MTDQSFLDEEYEYELETWGDEDSLDPELEGCCDGDLEVDYEAGRNEDLYSGQTDCPDLDQPSWSFGAWSRFLLIATIVACLCIAGILSLVTFNISSASDLSAASGSTSGQTNLARPETFIDDEGNQRDASDQSAENCRVSDQFPGKIRRWCGTITKYAGKRGLPPDLVAALILQESGGNPSAYSNSGAVGLMQVMPRDGIAASFACASGPCFSNRPSSGELQDPDFNVAYGTKMLAGLVSRHGSLREALKSYGPMNVGYYYADKVLGIYQRYGR